ncbi:hypothetical protein PY365_19130 [Roseiarcaceae bacterium H3SJ34-1]|uniref:hypothetical protein n=1 Tax=Terripilifer ovatus TaxID=3032367 RepID=UPI003AB96667|nr:hypothetical protein [Roseiarcaceae bacterium H3SJ34-1]
MSPDDYNLKQEVESLRAENAALRRMRARAPRRRHRGRVILSCLMLAAFVAVAVFSSLNKRSIIENAFDQIGRAFQ